MAAVREVAAPVTTVVPAPVAPVVDAVQETAATVDQTVQPVTGALGLERQP